MKRFVNDVEIQQAARMVADRLSSFGKRALNIYPVPRGGVPAFYAIRMHSPLTLNPVATPQEADVLVDDLQDSGSTRARVQLLNPQAAFYALITKGSPGWPKTEWLVMPWEHNEEQSIEDAFVRLLQYVGEDPTRGGLLETPARMAKAWRAWTCGYQGDPLAVLKSFEDGGEVYDEMVHVHDVPFYSQCEHHLAPFFGTITFAYVPDKRIVGLSKMPRLVDIFARRLQVQERLTSQIIDSFCEYVKPLGAGVAIRARHLCMESRGICQRGVVTTTAAFRGVLRDKPEARAEFFSLCK